MASFLPGVHPRTIYGAECKKIVARLNDICQIKPPVSAETIMLPNVGTQEQRELFAREAVGFYTRECANAVRSMFVRLADAIFGDVMTPFYTPQITDASKIREIITEWGAIRAKFQPFIDGQNSSSIVASAGTVVTTSSTSSIYDDTTGVVRSPDVIAATQMMFVLMIELYVAVLRGTSYVSLLE